MQYTTTNAAELRADLLGFVSEEQAADFFRLLNGVVHLLNEVPTFVLGRGTATMKEIQNSVYEVLTSDDWQTLCGKEWVIAKETPAWMLVNTLEDAERMLGNLPILIAKMVSGLYEFTKREAEAGATNSEVLQHELNLLVELVVDPLEQKLTTVPKHLLQQGESKSKV